MREARYKLAGREWARGKMRVGGDGWVVYITGEDRVVGEKKYEIPNGCKLGGRRGG